MVKKSRQAGTLTDGGLSLSPSDLKHESKERVRGRVGVPVRESVIRPFDAGFSRGPDAKERAAIWKGEVPPFDESWHRAMYDLNKELGNYLSSRVTIKIGRYTARTLCRHLVGDN